MYSGFRAAALAVSVALVLAACGGHAPGKAEDAAQAAAEPDGQQALTAKLNAYVTCFNRVDAKIHAGAKHYVGWMKDLAAGPTGSETRHYAPYDIDEYDMKPCDAPMHEAITAAPSLPDLDAAARRYAEALKTLQPISHQVYDYYEREDYEDDQFAKGKQLHAPLMSALGGFAEASAAFSDQLDAQNDAAQRAQLKAMEQAEGRTREYYRLAMMLNAKEIIGLMQADTFEVARAEALLQDFNRIADEAHAKVADQEPGKVDWNSFERAAENFRKQGRARVRRVVDKTPYTSIEQGWLESTTLAPDGSPVKLLKAYNDLVFQSNRQ